MLGSTVFNIHTNNLEVEVNNEGEKSVKDFKVSSYSKLFKVVIQGK